MRITDIDGNEGLNDEGDADIKTIEKEMEKFTKELEKDKPKIDLFAEIDCQKVQTKMKSLKEINKKILKIYEKY